MTVMDKKTSLRAINRRQKRQEARWLAAVPKVLHGKNIVPHRLQDTIGITNLYIEFCEHVLERFPGMRYVFLARDATPLHIVMRILKGSRGLPDEDRELTVTRNCLGERFIDATRTKYEPSRLRSFIRQSVRRRRRDTLINRYIEQELGDLDDFLMIDTGYWGTIPLYIEELLQAGSHFMVFGSDPDSCYRTDTDENGAAFYIERALLHGWRIRGHYEDDGHISVSRHFAYYEAKDHATDYFKVRVHAMERVKKKLTNQDYLAAWKDTLDSIPQNVGDKNIWTPRGYKLIDPDA